MHEPQDDLGQAISEGKDAATYLWQVPDDETTRTRVGELLTFIERESARAGRREMPQICKELLTAVRASSSPQQIDILQDGFDRLYKLWSAAKSGLGVPSIPTTGRRGR
jgi:hypothetical protein